MRFFAGIAVVCCGAASLAALPAAAAGQEELRRSVTPAPPNGATASSLPQVLDQANWDAGERGPLLVVDADNTPRVLGAGTLPPPGASGYRLASAAAYFARKIVPAGSLAVLAPTTMTVLNTRPGKPDVYAGLRPMEKMRVLLASLSAAQWRRLGGPRGLGDFSSPLQRDLFASLLPDPFRVRASDRPAPAFVPPDQGDSLTLSPGQRAGVRLRLRRSAYVYVPTPGKPGSFRGLDPEREARPEGTQTFVLVPEISRGGRGDAFGVALKTAVRNQLKPGDLAFDAPAFAAPLALGGATTVGELVGRAAKASGRELYADARAARLPVRVLGGERVSRRTGDVLKALCLALTGTFRAVSDGDETAYVLTDDLVGLGARRALLADWAAQAEALKREQTGALAAKIAAQRDAQQSIAFDADDPFALPPETTARFAPSPGRSSFGPGQAINIADLPPVYQRMIGTPDSSRNYSATYGFGSGGGPGFPREGQVAVSLRTRLVYVVPGVGAVTAPTMGGGSFDSLDSVLSGVTSPFGHDLPPPVAPAVAPVDGSPVPLGASGLADRVLVLSPASADEARQAVGAAKRRGFTHVWIGGQHIAPAVAAGRENSIAVFALVSLLGGENASRAAADLNLRGETGPEREARRRSAVPPTAGGAAAAPLSSWHHFDTPQAADALKRSVLALAATPGLGGLVLRDTAAPGYTDPGTDARFVSTDVYDYDFGYTPARRLRFLRQAGLDPIDLGGGGEFFTSPNLTLPFFRDSENLGSSFMSGEDGRVQTSPPAQTKTLAQQWNALRYQASVALMRDLHDALRADHPALPLFVAERTRLGSWGSAWYGSWDKADALPQQPSPFPAAGAASRPPDPLQQRRQISRRVLVNVPAARYGDAVALARGLRARQSSYQKSGDGIVLDLGLLPLDRALSLLDAVMP